MNKQKMIVKKKRKFRPVRFMIKIIKTIIALIILSAIALTALVLFNVIELSQIFDFLNKFGFSV